MSVIEIKDVRKSYGSGDAKTEILKGVSLSIEPGEFVAITGPSGSGKSTLMNIIGLLDTPDSGYYKLSDLEVHSSKQSSLSKLRLRYIGFIFQSFNLIAGLNAIENVELPMIYAKVKRQERRQRAFDLLTMVGIAERAKNKPNQLSGGQMQRVAIARSLVNSPQIILADEPTGNLDSQTGSAVMEILKQLNSQGTTIVMITHDPNIARQASRIVNISDGTITQPQQQATQPMAKPLPAPKPAVVANTPSAPAMPAPVVATPLPQTAPIQQPPIAPQIQQPTPPPPAVTSPTVFPVQRSIYVAPLPKSPPSAPQPMAVQVGQPPTLSTPTPPPLPPHNSDILVEDDGEVVVAINHQNPTGAS